MKSDVVQNQTHMRIPWAQGQASPRSIRKVSFTLEFTNFRSRLHSFPFLSVEAIHNNPPFCHIWHKDNDNAAHYDSRQVNRKGLNRYAYVYAVQAVFLRNTTILPLATVGSGQVRNSKVVRGEVFRLLASKRR